MDDLDILLSLVENPTRRRILERIVREPSYPLQLSRELGVSTQAVMKNLALLEQGGMVERTVVRSDMGPNRIVYSPGTEFTLVVDMRSHVFSARIVEAEEPDGTAEGDMAERLREIDERIEELDRERSRLVGERSRIASAMGSAEQAADSSAETVR
ncbi:MAG: helix-turn-helix domain-containing protein [Thermoplasmata archaeon]|nr:helix-turn-helix domain-containing protein [Thermoplasmata archaeon]